MTLESTINKNRYIGNGATTAFAFTFKVWKTNQVAVITGDGDTEQDVSSSCSIALSASGGTVTFPTAPASGTVIVIHRNMPYIQEDDYRNGARFDGEEVEDRFDQDCAERQDLRLEIGRAMKVPWTSSKTPEQYEQDLWDAYDDTLAKHEAVVGMHADVMAERPLALAAIGNAKTDALNGIAGAKSDAITGVDTARRNSLDDIENAKGNALYIINGAGETQVQRIENIVPIILSDKGHSCQEVNWVLDSDISAGATIDISPLVYVVGRHHVQVSCNGVRLYRTKQFDEVGNVQDAQSSLIKININLFAGDTVNVWIAGLAGTATHDFDGLLSAEDKTRLDSFDLVTSTSDGFMSKEDKVRLDSFDLATTSSDGFMSKEDKLKLDGIASSTSFNRATTTLANAVTAGTEITVPTHIVGEGLLFVWHNGILCEEGVSNQYVDYSTSSIKFNYDLPAGDTITAGAVYVSAS